MTIMDYKEKVKKYYNEMVTPFFGTNNFSSSEFLKTIKSDKSIVDGEIVEKTSLDIFFSFGCFFFRKVYPSK